MIAESAWSQHAARICMYLGVSKWRSKSALEQVRRAESLLALNVGISFVLPSHG